VKEREREKTREQESKVFRGDSEFGEAMLWDALPYCFNIVRLVNLVKMLSIMTMRRNVYVYNANVH